MNASYATESYNDSTTPETNCRERFSSPLIEKLSRYATSGTRGIPRRGARMVDRYRMKSAVRRPHAGPSHTSAGSQSQVVVSLTTFPARLPACVQTIRTVLRQSHKPCKLIVVLSDEQFSSPPEEFDEFVGSGLEVIMDRGDIGSYKKLIPTWEKYPNQTIVTADDDVLYPEWWLRDLVEEHRCDPGAILGHRGTRMVSTATGLRPYRDWPMANSTTSSSETFLTGMGGVLYPPNSLGSTVMDRELAVTLCPGADDIWFKVCALLARSSVRKISDGASEFYVDRLAQSTALHRVNVSTGKNDVYLDEALTYFGLKDRFQCFGE